jgi:crossover junction endodeoxyribonuclease RusA
VPETFEFIVFGTPRTHQTKSPKSRSDWVEKVRSAAMTDWPARADPIGSELSVLIIYFHEGRTALDIDNIIKPILDAMSGTIFTDDALVTEIRARKTRLGPGFAVDNPSGNLAAALASGGGFVMVRVEGPPKHTGIP